MAATDTRVATVAYAPVTALTGIFSNALAALAAWNESRATRSALSQLTDRELDDIGLSRSEIDIIARNF